MEDYITALLDGTMEFTLADISGPTILESAESCLDCFGNLKVCSSDGLAWCCEPGDEHPNCACQGGVQDLVNCPSSSSCSNSTFVFTKSNQKATLETTIQENADLCVFEISSEIETFLQFSSSESFLTIVDPGMRRSSCQSFPCQITEKVVPGNEHFAIFQEPTPNTTFSVKVDRSKVIFIQTWEVVVIVILATVALLLLLGIGICIFIYKRTPRGKGYGDLTNENEASKLEDGEGEEDYKETPLNAAEMLE